MGAPAMANGRQVFLPETGPNATVAVPGKAADVTCYVKTRWHTTSRRTFDDAAEKRPKLAAAGRGVFRVRAAVRPPNAHRRSP